MMKMAVEVAYWFPPWECIGGNEAVESISDLTPLTSTSSSWSKGLPGLNVIDHATETSRHEELLIDPVKVCVPSVS